MGTATKAIILSRVSSKEQEQGHSIEAQTQRLKEYCKRRSQEVTKTFEIVESSTITDRKKFMAMIDFAKRQNETIAIVVFKVDRLQRNFNEYPMLEKLLREDKVEIHFLTEGYYMHSNSNAHEKMMWGQGVLYAQSYIESIRDHVNRSIKHKLNKGECIGLVPIGYKNQRTPDNKSDVVLDKERAPLIKRLFEEYSTGEYSLEQLRKKTIEWGLTSTRGSFKPLSKSYISEILDNPFYYGILKYRKKDELYPHIYEPIISKRLFDTCQIVKLGKKHVRKHEWSTKEHVLKKLIKCASTDRYVTCDTKTKKYANGKTGSWAYLGVWDPKDVKKKIWVKEEGVLAQIEEALQALHLSSEEFTYIEKELLDNEEMQFKHFSRSLEGLNNEKRQIDKKLSTLSDMLLEELINKDEYKKKRTQLILEGNETDSNIEELLRDKKEFSKNILNTVKEASTAYERFKSSDNIEKRKILERFFEKLELKGEQLQYVIRYPYDGFVKN